MLRIPTDVPVLKVIASIEARVFKLCSRKPDRRESVAVIIETRLTLRRIVWSFYFQWLPRNWIYHLI